MDYIHRKLRELRLLMKFRNRNSGTMSGVVFKMDSHSHPHSHSHSHSHSLTDELDMLSMPSCSKYTEERSSNASTSDDNSITSLIGKKVYIKRSAKLCYNDAVRSASYSKSEFVLHSLQWHNILRSYHGVSPLLLSLDLCQRAQFWANHLSHTDSFYHRNEADIGENLLSKWSYYSEFDPSAEEIVKYWYNYMDAYDFSLDHNLLHTHANHFTQLIWKDSKYFGIGKARTRHGKLIVVANYKPAGNIYGAFHDNVLPPLLFDNDIDTKTPINEKMRERLQKVKLQPRRQSIPISTISGNKI